MPRSVNDFLGGVARDLVDPAFDQWSKTDLLGFMKDGLGLLLRHAPQQFTGTQDVTLVDGATQSLPDTAVKLVRPVCNLTGGNTPARHIRLVSLRALERAAPAWRSATQDDVTREVAYDPLTPDEFYVNPPANAGNKIRLECVVEQESIDFDDDLPIEQEYIAALHEYVVYRAFDRDDDYANADKARAHWITFLQSIGVDPSGAA